MMNWWKNGNPKAKAGQGNPSGRAKGNTSDHAQRIATETLREYNVATSHRHPERVMRYAGLTGNCKK